VKRLTITAALVLMLPAIAEAQRWRTMEVARQLRDSAEHTVRVRYGAGRLTLTPAVQPVLFDMSLRYDEERSEPVHRYDAEDRSLTVGASDVAGRGAGGRRGGSELRLALSPAVPIDLDVDLGAGRGEVELGGLSLRSLRLQSNAAETRVRFSRANLDRLRNFDIEAAAGAIRVNDGINARASTIAVRSRVGGVDLDLSGDWTESITIDADLAVGSLKIRVPEDVGVRVQGRRTLTRIEHGGSLQAVDGALVSDNWEDAAHRLDIRLSSRIGSLEIIRVR
jgi:hypothetical protein